MPKKKLPRLGINTGGGNVLDFYINEDGWCDVTMTEHRAVTRGIMTKGDLTALRDWLTEITHEPTAQEVLDALPTGGLIEVTFSSNVKRRYVKLANGTWIDLAHNSEGVHYGSHSFNNNNFVILYPTEEV